MVDEQSPDGARQRTLPLSVRQRWMSDLTHGVRETALNRQIFFDIEPAPVSEVLHEVIHQVVSAQPGLRLVLHQDNGESYFTISDTADFSFRLVDAGSWSGDMLETAVTEEAGLSFDLERGPVFRAVYFRTAAGYSLLCTFPKIIVDAVSLDIFAEQLQKALSGMDLEQVPNARFIAVSQKTQRQLEATGETNPLVDGLPVDRSQGSGLRASRQVFEHDSVVTQNLLRLASQLEVAPEIPVLASFLLFLGKHNGRSQANGALLLNPSGQTTDGVMGCFETVAAVRAELDECKSFRRLCLDLSADLQKAFSGEGPLISTFPRSLFVWHGDLEKTNYRLDGLIRLGDQRRGRPKFSFKMLPSFTSAADFCMHLGFAEGKMLGAVTYRDSVYVGHSIFQFIERWQIRLQENLAKPDQPIQQLPWFSEAERLLVLRSWTGVDRHLSRSDSRSPACRLDGATFLDDFEMRVSESPKSLALEILDGGERAVTYVELNRRANQTAHLLRAVGVRAGDIVAVSEAAKRTWVPHVLGVVKAGAIILPIPAHWAFDQWKAKLSEVGCRFLLGEGLKKTESSWDPICPVHGEEAAAMPTGNPGIHMRPEMPAILSCLENEDGGDAMFVFTHQTLVRHVHHLLLTRGIHPEDRSLILSGPQYGRVFEELLSILSVGACLVFSDLPRFPSVETLSELVEDEAITALHLPAGIWHAWVDAVVEARRSFPSKVRLVMVGGQPVCSERLSAQRRFSRGKFRWFNAYGPNASVFTATLFEDDGASVDGDVPIGKPLPERSVYVLDARLRPVAPGVPGRLYLAGACFSEGYHLDPKGTAHRFIPNPYADSRGARLYRTRDRARFLPDGNLEHIGTASQANLLPVAQLERALVTLQDVTAAAVVSNGKSPESVACVYLVFRSGAFEEDVRQRVLRFLTEYENGRYEPRFIHLLSACRPSGRGSNFMDSERHRDLSGLGVTPEDQALLQLLLTELKILNQRLGAHPHGGDLGFELPNLADLRAFLRARRHRSGSIDS